MKHVLLTGANGFVGQSLANRLSVVGVPVRLVVRKKSGCSAEAVVGDISQETNWSAALQNIDTVIHCAARAHVMNETGLDALSSYRSVNVAGTRNLAEQAAASGVRRFIYLSSIKVNGEQTILGEPYLSSDAPLPEDSYGISKWEAEQALHELASNTDMEIVIIRPPLVHGPKVKGNFLRLLRLVDKGVPLPFGLVSNARSLVGLNNLVDLLIHCIDHPAAAGQTLLVSDGEDISTADLIRRMARMMGKSSRLLPVPISMLRFAGRVTGRLGEVNRLVGSLQIDGRCATKKVGWTPPASLDEELKKTVDWYLTQ